MTITPKSCHRDKSNLCHYAFSLWQVGNVNMAVQRVRRGHNAFHLLSPLQAEVTLHCLHTDRHTHTPTCDAHFGYSIGFFTPCIIHTARSWSRIIDSRDGFPVTVTNENYHHKRSSIINDLGPDNSCRLASVSSVTGVHSKRSKRLVWLRWNDRCVLGCTL